MNMLFICRGNVGRSQMAEAILNKIAEGKHIASSCGTWVQSKDGESRQGEKLKDRPGAEKIIVSLREIGIEAGENQRDQLTPEMLADADKVIVMAEDYSIPDFLRACDKAVYWDVKDPKEMNQEDTNKIRDQIEGLVRNLVEII